jgi:hypothetical protein
MPRKTYRSCGANDTFGSYQDKPFCLGCLLWLSKFFIRFRNTRYSLTQKGLRALHPARA